MKILKIRTIVGLMATIPLAMKANSDKIIWNFTNNNMHHWQKVSGTGTLRGTTKKDHYTKTKQKTILSTLYVGRRTPNHVITMRSPVFQVNSGDFTFWIGGGRFDVGVDIYTIRWQKSLFSSWRLY
ncbi:hypothetical protein AAEX28_01465 [Lentisphaerota bacterium WC36G]|nr:hypothetical protein LJT99_04350 [Lentisphaerae bacterium WC36]